MQWTKNNIFVFFLYLILFITCSSIAAGIGISPADVYVNFVPGHEYVIDYSITSYRPFEFFTQGSFSEYVRIEELHHSDTQGNFRVHLVLPQDYEPPGKHRLYIVGKEKPSEGAVNTIAAIRGYIQIEVPFPGHYAELEIAVPDVNEGEPVPITVTVKNKGKEDISDASLKVDIITDDEIVETLRSESFDIETNGAYEFRKKIPGGDLKPGVYNLSAHLSYEGKAKEKSEIFRVGKFDVEILNYTDTMYNNSVNLFEIEVGSLWNNRIDTVYMDINIMDGSKTLSTIKTPPFDLLPWESKMSSMYWNTEGIPVGEYDLIIALHYGSEVKNLKRKIYIVDKPVEEKAMSIPLSTIVLIIVAVLLVVFNLYFIIAGKRRKKKEEEKEDQ